MKWRYILILFILLSVNPFTFARDGIPDNCETARDVDQLNLFPRYEFHNQRLVLVDWRTGEDHTVLESNLTVEAFHIQEWTIDCQHLLGSVTIDGLSHLMIWNTTRGERVFDIATGHPSLSTYHLYLDDDVIVETINGGVWVNIPSHNIITLNAPWNEISNRNFAGRPQFDSQHGWILATTAEGNRVAYQQANGHLVPDFQAVQIAETNPTRLDDCLFFSATNDPEITVGYYVNYEDHQVNLYNTGNLLKTLSDNIETEEFLYRGFSSDCLYYVGHILKSTTPMKIYDTIVWDTSTNQQLVFEDAQYIPHPLKFLSKNRILISTRDGAFLWKLDTDERVQLNNVAVDDSGYYGASIDNFKQTQVIDDKLWVIAYGDDTILTAFDIQTGQRIATYDNNADFPISYELINNNEWLVINSGYTRSNNSYLGIWNIESGTHYYLMISPRPNFYVNSDYLMSEDNRYFLYTADSYRHGGYFYLWDLQNLNPDGTPTNVTPVEHLTHTYSSYSIFQGDIVTISERSYNVYTGELLDKTQETNQFVIAPVPSASTQPPICQPKYRLDTEYYWLQFINDGEIQQEIKLDFIPERSGYISSYYYGRSCFLYVEEDDVYRYIWDANTLESLPLPEQNIRRIYSTSSDLAVVSYRLSNSYDWDYGIWNIRQGTVIPLVVDFDGYWSISSVRWDYSRGQILTTDYHHAAYRVFDIQTGQMRAYYEGNTAYFSRSDATNSIILDNTWLLIRGEVVNTFHHLDREQSFALPRTLMIGKIALSPSGRYVASMGETEIRVWNMDNQPEAILDRVPNFVFEKPDEANEIRFVSETTIALTLGDGQEILQDVVG